MPRILFLPDDETVEASGDETIQEAAGREGIPLAHVCGGRARCSTCRVAVLEGLDWCDPRTPSEEAIAGQMDFSSDIRLACQTRARGEVTVRRLVLDTDDIEMTSLFIQGDDTNRAGSEKRVLIMFADIRSFTAFAEDLLPYDVIHVLNRYFRQMEAIVRSHGGSVNNYMGDGLIALFEADDPPAAALRSVQAGLEMLQKVERLGPYLDQLYRKRFHIGIGLHYGLVVAGTVGTADSQRNTVIGDAVNFASRVEAANKEAGTLFLISEDVRRLLGDRVPLGRTVNTTIQGKSGTHKLHEVQVPGN